MPQLDRRCESHATGTCSPKPAALLVHIIMGIFGSPAKATLWISEIDICR